MEWLNRIYHIVWGAPLLVLVMGVGIYYTFALRGLQFRYLIYALKLVVVPETSGFLATVVMCTVTGLVLGVTGVFGSVGADGKMINGASLTASAFEKAQEAVAQT